MPTRSPLVALSWFVLLSLEPAVAVDRPPAIVSAWCATPHVADGSDAEWPETSSTVPGMPVAVSVANDADYLYLRLRAAENLAQVQLLFGGLTVWFDPGGGEKKAFGVRYPVPSPVPTPGPRGARPGASGSHDRPEPGAARGPRGRPPSVLDPSDIVPRRLELLGPAKDDVRSLVLDHAPGITVGLGRIEGVLVYELKVPLAKSAATPYAIGASSASVIGIGFETAKVERPKPPEGMRGGSLGMGGMGGMGVPGMGPGRGGPDAGEKPEWPKPWKVWARVDLARDETTPSGR